MAVSAPKDNSGIDTSTGVSERPACCSLYHRAIELVGKRWSGAILLVLMDGPAHFSGIMQLVPEISDRLLSERLKELESEGLVERTVIDEGPVRVEYALTEKGRALEPLIDDMRTYGATWLGVGEAPAERESVPA